MNKIWFCADTHYNHSNICRGITKWVTTNKTRDFQTLEEMNDAIIAGINKCAKEGDTLYFLGDWSFGGIESIYEFYKRLLCKEIYFIPGNHDEHIKKDHILPNCWIDREWNIIGGSNPKLYNDARDNVFNAYGQSIFKIEPALFDLKIGKQKFVLCHYPLQNWEDMDNGTIHLHGHNHHQLDSDPLNVFHKRMDVGLDWEEFRPFSLDEILEKMSTRRNLKHRII
ncbi:MAG: metallophosphoesterase [Candidatus Saccharimonadaceae bacterium]